MVLNRIAAKAHTLGNFRGIQSFYIEEFKNLPALFGQRLYFPIYLIEQRGLDFMKLQLHRVVLQQVKHFFLGGRHPLCLAKEVETCIANGDIEKGANISERIEIGAERPELYVRIGNNILGLQLILYEVACKV